MQHEVSHDKVIHFTISLFEMVKRGRASPSWLYVDGVLCGPAPLPRVPPVVSVHAGEFGAHASHCVAEVDQERCVVRLGDRVLPHSWDDSAMERSFWLRDWYGDGWYARYRRVGSRFVLSSVHVDGWAWSNVS